MNVSPHHQHPTKYPWPGMASRLIVIVALVVVLFIGFLLIADPFGNANEADDSTALRAIAAHRI
jgi:hypothetical protein